MGNAQLREESGESYLDELAPGTELLQGQFTIKEFLNSGGFGITYLATDSLERKVVIKECFPSSFCNRSRTIVQARSRAHQQELQSVVQLFVQEARSLAKLDHPNIVGVHQVFEDNETAYMVLDFVEGRDLLDILEDANHTLTAPQIKGILKDVLSAVQFIHEQDILHRDISPDNILLDSDLRPVLIDFGAAREEATKKSRVLSAMRVVKDGYSPQEFYVQGSVQSPSSDLYALAATFYHLIVGEIPPNSQARLAAIASNDPDPYQPLAGRIKGFDAKFLSALDKAMAILPKDRVQSAQEWLEMMESGRRKSRVITQQVPMSSAVAEANASAKRSRLVPLLGSVAAVGVLALGGMAYTGAISVDTLAGLTGGATTAPVAAEEPAEVVAEAPSIAPAAPGAAEPEFDLAALAAGTAPVETANTPETPASDTTTPAFDLAALAAATAPVDTVGDAETEAEAAVTDAPAFDLAALAAETTPVDAAIASDDPASDGLAGPSVPVEAAVVPVIATPNSPVLSQQAVPTAPDFMPEGIAPLSDAIAKVAPEIAPVPGAAVSINAPASDDASLRQAALPDPVAEPATTVADASPVIALDAEEVSPAVADETPLSETPVTTEIRVGLPFDGVPDSNSIAQAAIVAPVWVRPGAKIVAVNGTDVSDIEDIHAIAAEARPTSDAGRVTLQFTVLAEGAATSKEFTWQVPVIYRTSLPNGTTFATREADGVWKTVVTDIRGTGSELRVGDEVVAYVPTSEKLEGQAALQDILEREIAKGTQQFNFAVSRDGSMWVVSMSYAEGA